MNVIRKGELLFILQRIVTFIVGILILGLVYVTWKFSEPTISGIILGIIPFSIIGIYFVIAAIVPDRQTTKDVSGVVAEFTLIEFPVWLIRRGLNRISDWL